MRCPSWVKLWLDFAEIRARAPTEAGLGGCRRAWVDGQWRAMRELLNDPLAPRTTLQVGGPARRLLEIDREEQLIAAVRQADDAGEPLVLLGGGSNVVFADTALQATVVLVATRGIHHQVAGDRVEVTAAAGEPWDDLVTRCSEDQLAGIECLAGIPGRVGATPIQNVGAYGQQVADTLVRLRALDRTSGQTVTIDAKQCGFGYRDSIFKSAQRGRYVILEVTLGLRHRSASLPRHGELRSALDDCGASSPTPARVREAVLSLRRRKGMLLSEQDPDSRSAGSFFTNPVVTPSQADRVASHARDLGLTSQDDPMPRYETADGRVKLAAAWLIERCGFAKGYGVGPVGLSRKHTLAIVNRGGATAQDVLRLAREIRGGVEARLGVRLWVEPTLIGFGTAARDLTREEVDA